VNSRREFLIGAAAPLLLAWPARSAPICALAPTLGANLCRAYIDSMNASQETDYGSRDSRAIWVACVAVVFAIYRHIVPQSRILAEAYGSLDKIPTDAGFAVALPLARAWRDEDGVDFRASFEPVFDDSAASGGFDPKPLFGAIANGDPLILIGNRHPVVLLGLAYTPDRPDRLVAGFALDPKPTVGRRSLDRDELVPNTAGGDLLLAVRTKLEKL